MPPSAAPLRELGVKTHNMCKAYLPSSYWTCIPLDHPNSQIELFLYAHLYPYVAKSYNTSPTLGVNNHLPVNTFQQIKRGDNGGVLSHPSGVQHYSQI